MLNVVFVAENEVSAEEGPMPRSESLLPARPTVLRLTLRISRAKTRAKVGGHASSALEVE
jgi:hypothetical protein